MHHVTTETLASSVPPGKEHGSPLLSDLLIYMGFPLSPYPPYTPRTPDPSDVAESKSCAQRQARFFICQRNILSPIIFYFSLIAPLFCLSHE